MAPSPSPHPRAPWKCSTLSLFTHQRCEGAGGKDTSQTHADGPDVQQLIEQHTQSTQQRGPNDLRRRREGGRWRTNEPDLVECSAVQCSAVQCSGVEWVGVVFFIERKDGWMDGWMDGWVGE